MRPSQTVTVMEDLCNSYTGPLFRKGLELSSRDRATVLEVYQQWLLLAVDLGYLSSGKQLKRSAQRLFTDMVKADVLDLNAAFTELLQLVRLQDSTGFKGLCRRVSTHLYNMVREDFWCSLENELYSARRLVQLFSYTGRLSLVDIDLTDQCLQEYREIERSIKDLQSLEPLLRDLNKIVKAWMKSFDPDRIKFQHGPGSVAGIKKPSLKAKYKSLTFDQMLCYAFGEPWWALDPSSAQLDRTSQTIFVPKSYKTFRTISMEPATLQYCQQGVWKEIDRVVGSSSWLRSRIGFHDQDRNQELAKLGSLERSYATLDLSAASDSVSYYLVKRLFRGTKLLRFIVATRSRWTRLPDGTELKLRKFAPMGSALCFPIETIIFAAVCHHVTRNQGVAGDFSVFGDDIIVPTQTAEVVMTVLGRLGFRVNREKSFFQPDVWFRESCGAEYCDGFDVTPMRVSRKYRSDVQLVDSDGLIKLANTAYQLDYRALRQFYLRKLWKVGWVPFFGPNGLLGDSYSNYHTDIRWNFNLHRLEILASQKEARYPKRKEIDESLRLRHWLEVTQDRTAVQEGFVADIESVTLKVKDRWIPKPYDAGDTVIARFLTEKGKAFYSIQDEWVPPGYDASGELIVPHSGATVLPF